METVTCLRIVWTQKQCEADYSMLCGIQEISTLLTQTLFPVLNFGCLHFDVIFRMLACAGCSWVLPQRSILGKVTPIRYLSESTQIGFDCPLRDMRLSATSSRSCHACNLSFVTNFSNLTVTPAVARLAPVVGGVVPLLSKSPARFFLGALLVWIFVAL